jgi:hypothetical protein
MAGFLYCSKLWWGGGDTVFRSLSMYPLVTRWHSWLRHCATNRKVACSIPRCGHWGFSSTWSFRRHCSPGFDSASDKWVPASALWGGGKGGRCVGLTPLPLSCADCLEILGASTSWSPKGLSRPVVGKLYLYLFYASTALVDKVSHLENVLERGGITPLILNHLKPIVLP